MKKHEYESKYNPAVKDLSQALRNDGGIRPDTLEKITNVLEGIKHTDEMISQKEQLLVQKEKELVRLKSITDNSSKVARDIISESKGNLDQAVSLHKSGNFSEALKYSDIALYNIGDINSFGVKTVEQANKLYVERLELYKEAAAKRDYFYNQSVINGVNAFSWVKDNPTRDFYTFFREVLNIPDKEQKSPENVNLIQNRLYKNLPKYLEEAQRTSHFYNEYNKYYDVMTKLQQVVNIHNIRAASNKGLKDYEEALKSCEIALAIDPTSSTLVNLKNAVLKEKQAVEFKKVEEEKLLASQSKEIEKLKEVLARKEVETQEKNKLLTQKGNELVSKEKVLIDQHKKETEGLKALLARKDKEVKELEKVKNEFLKKELLEILPQAYPSDKSSGYNKPFSEWDSSWYGKKVIDTNNFESIKSHLPGLREKAARIKEENLKKQAKELENTKKLEEENLKKEELLGSKDKLLSDKEQEIAKFKELLSIKEIETKNKDQLLFAKELETGELLAQKEKENKELLALKEKQAKELENAKRLQEENVKKEQLLSNQNKLLSDKEQRIEELKALIEQSKIEKEELLAQQELAVSNKSHMKNQIIDGLLKEVHLKENEAVDLRLQNLEKELITEQKEKLLIQKESEIADKNDRSFIKNQVINELQDNIGLKEKEAYKLQIELLMKQVEFHKKESELKDKALADAHEIVKQNKIINELQEKLLAFQNLSKHDETLKLELSVIHFKVEESILNGNVDEMKELSKYLSQLMKNPADEDESLDISELLNLSPIVNVEENPVQQNVPVINHGNFDINQMHITHSVLLGGEGSESFSIIKEDHID